MSKVTCIGFRRGAVYEPLAWLLKGVTYVAVGEVSPSSIVQVSLVLHIFSSLIHLCTLLLIAPRLERLFVPGKSPLSPLTHSKVPKRLQLSHRQTDLPQHLTRQPYKYKSRLVEDVTYILSHVLSIFCGVGFGLSSISE